MKTVMILIGIIFHTHLFALDLDVEIKNRKSNGSILSCAIFERAEGFPMDSAKRLSGVLAETGQNNVPVCKFKGLASKKYAVAVLEDLNGNGDMDKTFIGIPKEPWGVSNDVPAHTFGPPNFDEAAFQLTTNKTIQIKLKQ
jgi:uncharacterized protein (DUF2141 family)